MPEPILDPPDRASEAPPRPPVEDLVDPRRSEPAFVLPEREMLEAWLEFHRTTLLLKCEGVDDAARKARPLQTSLLSLHGLVRHMAEVERNWFTRTLLSDPGVPPLFSSRGPDGEADERDLFPIEDADWPHDLAVWHQECASSRENASRLSLDHCGSRRGNQVSLRWIYLHMIEEYARHNGHADLIREIVDGTVGW